MNATHYAFMLVQVFTHQMKSYVSKAQLLHSATGWSICGAFRKGNIFGNFIDFNISKSPLWRFSTPKLDKYSKIYQIGGKSGRKCKDQISFLSAANWPYCSTVFCWECISKFYPDAFGCIWLSSNCLNWVRLIDLEPRLG